MASELKHTVQEDGGGDFTTLAAAVDHLEAAHANHVTADVYSNVEISGAWDAEDTGTVLIHNLTLDATRYLNIYCTGDSLHDGSSYRNKANSYGLAPAANVNSITVSETYVRIHGLQIKAANQSNGGGIYLSGAFGAGSQIYRNIIKAGGSTSGSTGYQGIRCRTGSNVWNNIIYGFTNASFEGGLYDDESGTTKIYNNTVYGCRVGCRNNWGSGTWKNNLCNGNTTDWSDQGGGFISTTNLSEDNTSPTVALRSQVVHFVDETAGSEDFHLASDDTHALDAGTDLSADIFTDDIDGVARVASWDIGADEYVAAGGSTINLLAAIAGTSATPVAVIALARALLSNTQVVSTTPSAVSSVMRAILSNIPATSLTPSISIGIARAVLAMIFPTSLTPAIVVSVVRSVLATITATTTTADITATMAGLIQLVVNISATSSTPGISAVVVRDIVANIVVTSTTPNASATILRALLSALSGVSVTPAVSATIARSLLSTIPATSVTPDILVSINRYLLASILVSSLTSDIAITIQGVLLLLSNIAAVSVTSDISAIVARSIVSNLASVSLTPDVVSSLTRSILASISVTSSTPDITSSIENMLALSAAIVGVSLTPAVTAQIARSLATAVLQSSVTQDVLAETAREILASIQGTSVTVDDVIISLNVLGVILDTDVTSKTVERSLVGVTPVRTIESDVPPVGTKFGETPLGGGPLGGAM